MREAEIEQYLVEQVKKLGGDCRKVQWVGRRGAPDRVVMVPAKALTVGVQRTGGYAAVALVRQSLLVWVELKAPGEKPKPHQIREHDRLRKLGQCVEVIDSMEGVDALLGGI